LVVRVVRFAVEPAFGADRAVEVLRELVARVAVERPVAPEARDPFERDVAPARALVERDAVDRPAVPERAPDFAVELLARDVVALLVGRDRVAPPVEGVLAALRLDVLRLDVLRLDVLRDPELDAVVFFLAVLVEGLRCLGK
jgi:hypothetical protein